MLQHALHAFLVAAVLSPFGYYAGATARRLQLPQLTGYLVAGIMCGPYMLGILSQESVSDLSVIEAACLGIIGVAAGAELHLPELNRAKKQVTLITAAICCFTWPLCYAALLWASDMIPSMPHMGRAQAVAIASLGATIMMARSPASAIAVVKEMEAKGTFTSLVMGVVVLKDVVVVVSFAINMQIVPLVLAAPGSTSRLGPRLLLLPLLSVLVSVSAGLVAGYALSLALQYNVAAWMMAGRGGGGPSAPERAAAALRCKQLLVLLLATGCFVCARAIDAEPLLACMTMGMLAGNRRPERAEGGGEDVSGLVNGVMAVTNVAFFALAGASLKLAAIADAVWIGLVVFLARLVAIIAGSAAGCAASGVRPEHARVFWMSMVTQAGVAIGLARIAATTFTSWGSHFQTVMLAIILINLMLGPPLFRAVLVRVGEARGAAGGLPTQQRKAEGAANAAGGGAGGGEPPCVSGGSQDEESVLALALHKLDRGSSSVSMAVEAAGVLLGGGSGERRHEAVD